MEKQPNAIVRLVVPLILGGLLLPNGCTPKGKIIQTVTSANSPENAAITALSAREIHDPTKGEGKYSYDLPNFCQLVQAEGGHESCIICKTGSFPIERCFAAAHAFSTRASCGFNQKELKCLVSAKKPVLTISFDNNEETDFTKNFPVFLNTVKSIAQLKVNSETPDIKLQFEILEYLAQSAEKVIDPAQKYVILRDLDELMARHRVASNIRSATARSLSQALDQVSKQRRNGKLALIDGLHVAQRSVSQLPSAQNITNIMQDISLDGLENPADTMR